MLCKVFSEEVPDSLLFHFHFTLTNTSHYRLYVKLHIKMDSVGVFVATAEVVRVVATNVAMEKCRDKK